MSFSSPSIPLMNSQGIALAPPTLAAFLRGERMGADIAHHLPKDEAALYCLDALRAAADNRYAELSQLVEMDSNDFWREVAHVSSLDQFIDSYLRFCHRCSDNPDQGPRGVIDGVLIGEKDLQHQVLLFLHRISSCNNGNLDFEQHAALLQKKKLLDLPKLMDLCVIYGVEYAPLVRELVGNAIRSQPSVLQDISTALSYFLHIFNSFYYQSMECFEISASSYGSKSILTDRQQMDFLKVADFMSDAVITMDYFINAYKPAAILFSRLSELRSLNNDLLNILGRVHDTLIPQFNLELPFSNVTRRLNYLCDDIQSLGQNLLVICYLTHNALSEGFDLLAITKKFPAMVGDSAIKGDILFQILIRVNGEISTRANGMKNHVSLLKSIELRCSLLAKISRLREKGWIFLDEWKYTYVSKILMPPSIKADFFQDEDEAMPESEILEGEVLHASIEGEEPGERAT